MCSGGSDTVYRVRPLSIIQLFLSLYSSFLCSFITHYSLSLRTVSSAFDRDILTFKSVLLPLLPGRLRHFSVVTYVFSFNYSAEKRGNEFETSQFVRVFVNQKRQTLERGVCVRVWIVGNEFALRFSVAHWSAVHQRPSIF